MDISSLKTLGGYNAIEAKSEIPCPVNIQPGVWPGV